MRPSGMLQLPSGTTREVISNMLTKEQRDNWTAALRSGDYRQTTGQLKEGRSYCCLGVLCETLGWDIPELNMSDISDYTYSKLDTELSGWSSKCITMNDDEQKTFPEIAAFIYANIPVS